LININLNLKYKFQNLLWNHHKTIQVISRNIFGISFSHLYKITFNHLYIKIKVNWWITFSNNNLIFDDLLLKYLHHCSREKLKLLLYIFSICPKDVTDLLDTYILNSFSFWCQNKMGVVLIQYQYRAEIIYVVISYIFLNYY